MKIDKKAVGRRIKQLRLKKGYTQEELAKLIDAGKSSVSNWENGIETPTGWRLFQLLNELELSIHELLYGENKEDIEYIYKQVIKLSKNDATTLINKVNEYFGGEQQC